MFNVLPAYPTRDLFVDALRKTASALLLVALNPEPINQPKQDDKARHEIAAAALIVARVADDLTGDQRYDNPRNGKYLLWHASGLLYWSANSVFPKRLHLINACAVGLDDIGDQLVKIGFVDTATDAGYQTCTQYMSIEENSPVEIWAAMNRYARVYRAMHLDPPEPSCGHHEPGKAEE